MNHNKKSYWKNEPFYWAPTRTLSGGWICYKDSPSPPPPPDYAGAAQAQGQANLEAARASAKLSNPNLITPYGNQTVTYGRGSQFDEGSYNNALQNYYTNLNQYNSSGGANQKTYSWKPHVNAGGYTWVDADGNMAQIDPNTNEPVGGLTQKLSAPVMPNKEDFMIGGDPDVPTVTQTLSAPQQALLDKYNNINLNLGDIATQGLSYVQRQLNSPFNQAALPTTAVNAGQTFSDAAWGRLQPKIDQSNQQLEADLANKGITQGSEAWKNAWRQQNESQNDLKMQLAAGSLNADQAARQQAIQEQAFFRNEPLNTLNAVRSSAQIQNPQFQGYQGSQVQGAPIFQAAQAQGQADMGLFNAQSANANSQQQGLMGLGTTAAMMF